MSILDSQTYPKISQLTNGLRIATIPIKSELSTIGIWVKSGSIYEDTKTSGVAHFLEHILFRGNQKYPQYLLEDLAEKNGINLMAATSRVTTSFFAQVNENQISKATDVLSQIVLNPNIEQKTVDNERSTILAEEFEVSHDFNETIWDKLHKASFGDSSIGMPILGDRDTILNISSEMIKNHHNKFFNPSNCIFIAATKIPHEKIVENVINSTNFLKNKKNIIIDMKIEDEKVKPKFKPQLLLYNSEFINNSWCSIAIEAPSINSNSFIPCQLIKAGIGDINYKTPMEKPFLINSSSILRLQTHYFPYGSSGILAFLGNSPFGKEQQWMTDIMNTLQTLTSELTPNNLNLAKLRLKSQLAKNLTSTRAVADELGMNLLLKGRWRSLEDWGNEINLINKDNMIEFAMNYLHQKPFSGTFVVLPPSQQKIQSNSNSTNSKIIKPNSSPPPKTTLITK